MRDFSLSYFTVPELDPLGAIEVAAEAGYAFVGLRPVRPRPAAPAQQLLGDARLLRDVAARTRATGVGILDLEFLWITEDFDPAAHAALGAAGQQLGAKAVLAGGNDPDPARLADRFAILCDAMAPYGLAVSLECVSYAAVGSIAVARRIIEAAGSPANAGILIDALHFSQAGGALDEIAAMPASWMHSAQLCDAMLGAGQAHEQIVATALSGRLPPGEGNIDLAGLIRHLPPDIPLSLEIPNAARCAAVGELVWAKQALAAAQAMVLLASG